MRLYLIRRKYDRKFFVAINGHWALETKYDPEVWAVKPRQFYFTPDGIAGNLRKLCSEPYWDDVPPKGVHPSIARGWRELAWKNFDASKLTQFEVIAIDVDVVSMTAIPATDFIQIEAIENKPLRSKEREVTP